MDNRISSISYPLDFKCKPYTRYYWRVTVEADNEESATSECAWFETAKLEEAWEGKWITKGTLDTQNPLFKKEFVLHEDIEDARIYACGLGLYELFIDGAKIGNEYLTPNCNNYAKWLQYQTYEVSLKKGKHIVTASLGNGGYKGKFSLDNKENIYGDRFKLILELRDHRKLICSSDESWQVSKGCIIENSIYDGEIYKPSLYKEEAIHVQLLEGDYDKLQERLSLPLVVKEKLR
ncbi:MAG: alpha-L-rhamnosidase N-terminal domain-containing protein [Suipraeoptans sp.]